MDGQDPHKHPHTHYVVKQTQPQVDSTTETEDVQVPEQQQQQPHHEQQAQPHHHHGIERYTVGLEPRPLGFRVPKNQPFQQMLEQNAVIVEKPQVEFSYEHYEPPASVPVPTHFGRHDESKEKHENIATGHMNSTPAPASSIPTETAPSAELSREATVNPKKNGVRIYKDWDDTPEASSLHKLTEENLSAFLKENESVLVMFYAPWCGFCRAMKSDFASAAASLNQDQSSAATLAVLNCDLYPKVKNHYQVGGYPTLKYFRNGHYIGEYNRARHARNFVDFMHAAPKTSRELDEYLASN